MYPRRRLRANCDRLEAAGTRVLVFEPDNALSKTIGLNAMAPHRLHSILHATTDFVNRRLTALSAEDEVVVNRLSTPADSAPDLWA